MCDFDEFVFTCGHSTFRLKAYCHRARNDPYKEYHYVKKLRDVWDQTYPCSECVNRAQAAAAAAQQGQQAGQHQGDQQQVDQQQAHQHQAHQHQAHQQHAHQQQADQQGNQQQGDQEMTE